ncbi:hypothetical protein [Halobiforma nitratireducens]|uniref:DUF8152 domain-containing protein n=1 Tax=Halobiforma nitratireducens JCM 10879 TaxID=1227454 RepID=M0M937_9EURY|nr:hypothetical protein [Halobiforma nitratireducens]EMA41129.1 hypothetical protein C446_06215 [Halobiforma nitratireducens JCM 10879]
MTDNDSDRAHVAELARHLEATSELPIERSSSRVLGEAEAVARDAAVSDLEDEIVRERVETVRDLLDELEGVDHEEARAHVEAAVEHCDVVLGNANGTGGDAGT